MAALLSAYLDGVKVEAGVQVDRALRFAQRARRAAGVADGRGRLEACAEMESCFAQNTCHRMHWLRLVIVATAAVTYIVQSITNTDTVTFPVRLVGAISQTCFAAVLVFRPSAGYGVIGASILCVVVTFNWGIYLRIANDVRSDGLLMALGARERARVPADPSRCARDTACAQEA